MRRAIYFAGMMLLCSSASYASVSVRVVTEDTSIHINVNRGRALDLLIEIAHYNHIPLGLVLIDSKPCRQDIALADEQVNTVNELLEIINEKVDGYEVQLKDGTVVVQPSNPQGPTRDLLTMPIDNFKPITPTMESFNENLWMYIRTALNPTTGTIASIPYNLDEPKLTNFDVPSHSSVEAILNILVQQNAGGAWLLGGLTEQWRNNLSETPFKIYSYSQETTNSQIYTCSLVK